MVIILLTLITLLATSCSDEVETTYASLGAYFNFSPVTSAAPLYHSLNNGGLYTIITYSDSQISFTGNDGSSATANRTALSTTYTKYTCLDGFIVGTPSVPDYNGNFYNICFELACANCYHESWVQRKLRFAESGSAHVYCSRCGRTYDLDNYGIIIDGDDGISLYRYRLSYVAASDLLLINNG